MTDNRVSKLILPGTPSERFQIGQRVVNDTTFQDDPPDMDSNISKSLGFNVADWQEVYVFQWIDDDEAGYDGASVVIAPWRFYRFPRPFVNVAGSVGDYPEGGLWVVDTDIEMALDADGLAISQGAVFHTLNADRMFFQVKTFNQGTAEADPLWLKQAVVGITPRSTTGQAVGASSAAAAGGGAQDVNIIEVLGNVAAAGAGVVTAGTLRITWADDSPGIGEHDAVTDDPGFRALGVAHDGAIANVDEGDDVHIATNLAGEVRVAGYNFTTGEIEISFGGNSWGTGAHDVATAVDGLRALAVATDVDPAAVANQDDAHIITDLYGRLILAGYARLGDLLRIQETDPINFFIAHDLIQESSMGTAGSPYVYYIDLDTYYRMSHQVDIALGSAAAGGVVYKIWGTVEDDDPDLTARTYLDRTTAISGGPSITVDALIEDINGIHGNYTAVKLEVSVVNASNDSAIRIDTKRFIGG